jgi:hypothetical protein
MPIFCSFKYSLTFTMNSGIGSLFLLLALGAVLSYARPNMELPLESKTRGSNEFFKREVQVNSDKVETSETNVQIPENQDVDQTSNLDTEKLNDPEDSANLGDSDISRESIKFSKNGKIKTNFRTRH